MKTEFPLLTLRGRISVILNGAYWVLALGDAASTVVGKLMVVVLPTTSREAPNLLLVLVPGFDSQSAPMSRKWKELPKASQFPRRPPRIPHSFPTPPAPLCFRQTESDSESGGTMADPFSIFTGCVGLLTSVVSIKVRRDISAIRARTNDIKLDTAKILEDTAHARFDQLQVRLPQLGVNEGHDHLRLQRCLDEVTIYTEGLLSNIRSDSQHRWDTPKPESAAGEQSLLGFAGKQQVALRGLLQGHGNKKEPNVAGFDA